MNGQPEKLPVWKLVIFALGQLGWSLASYGVSNLITYFYMPPETADTKRIFPPFIFAGAVIGVFTVIGIINFVSRFFDAVTNPLLASLSDRSRARMGRRRFYLAISALPFALFSYLVFTPPQSFSAEPALAASWLNIAWLVVTILLFYFFFVMYFAPYNALISELGHNPKERLVISTVIGVTWSLGFAIGNFVYDFQVLFERSGLGSVAAFQRVQAIFALVAFPLMLLPVIFIDEKRYAAASISNETTMQALRSSLGNRNFMRFLVAEFLYNVCQTTIQMGIIYYVVTLLRLEKEMTSFLMMAMFILSFVFYPFITMAAVKWEKKRVTSFGFVMLALLFGIFALYGIAPLPPLVMAWITIAVAAVPVAIFTITANAIVADIAEADGIETGNFKAGMFFGVRSFETNLGVSAANILFPSFLLLGMTVAHPLGIRLSAVASAVICVAGFAVFRLYDERAVLRSLAKKERLSNGEVREIENRG